jgi:hypothetical protein
LAIQQDLLGELGIIMNFNDHTVIPMKDRDTGTLSSVEALIEVYMSEMIHKRSEMNFVKLLKF